MTIEEENNKVLQEILKQLTEVVKLLTPKPVSKKHATRKESSRDLFTSAEQRRNVK